MFGDEETLGINGKGEYNQQFQGLDGHNFKKLSNKALKQLQYWKFPQK